MENKELVKYQGGLIKHVSNAINVTNKLLALSEPELIPYRKGDKWGFCTADKKIIIECLYEDVNFFSERLAAVKQNKKWGYINRKGELKIPCIYEIATAFSNGEASVSINYEDGIDYIDKDQNLLYTSYQKFLNDGKNIKTPNIIQRIRRNGKWGFTIGGKIIIECKYEESNQFREDLAPVKINGKWGFIDKNDTTSIPFIYNYAGYFSHGLANVVRDDKYGFIDRNNNIVIPFIYDSAYSFQDGLASVRQNGKYGFIDVNGNIILDFIYFHADSFSRGFANVDLNNNKGYINKSGVQYWED